MRPPVPDERLLKDATEAELEHRLAELREIEQEAARPEWDKWEERMREADDFEERRIVAQDGPLARFKYVVGYMLESESTGKRIYKCHKFVALGGTGNRGYQKRGFREPKVENFSKPFNWPGEEIIVEGEGG